MHELVLAKVGDSLLDLFAEKIIRRWSRYRAERFFSALVEGLATGALSEAQAVEKVQTALNDEQKSEVLFESYRRVCLSASKEVGPRFIGLLTAKILSESRTSTEQEEELFRIAEVLSDSDFLLYIEFLEDSQHRESKSPTKGPRIVFEINREWTFASDLSFETEISPVNLGEVFGIWALKLISCGALVQRVQQKRFSYREDSERGIDEPGVQTTYSWYLEFSRKMLDYVELLHMAISPEKARAGCQQGAKDT